MIRSHIEDLLFCSFEDVGGDTGDAEAVTVDCKWHPPC